ncbi:MAG: hypothetical protein ABJC26_16910 [Gemmatimonadaceae bacterium]
MKTFIKNSWQSKIRTVAALVAMTTLSACASKSNGDPTVPANHDTGTPLPTEVTLAPGTYADITNANLRVIFDNVESDSRCPTSVACVWAGAATVNLTTSLISADKNLRLVKVSTEPGKDTATVYGQALRLVRVDPTPTTTTPLPLSSYRVTIRVGLSR